MFVFPRNSMKVKLVEKNKKRLEKWKIAGFGKQRETGQQGRCHPESFCLYSNDPCFHSLAFSRLLGVIS